MVLRCSTLRSVFPPLTLAIAAVTFACQSPSNAEAKSGDDTTTAARPTTSTHTQLTPDITPMPDPVGLSDNQRVYAELEGKTLNKIEFTKETGDYVDVVKLIRTVTDIPIILTPEARQVIDEESLVLEIKIVAPISVKNLLDLMVSKSDALAWNVQHGVVQLGTKATLAEANVLVTHDVRDLVFPRTEFLPPVIRGIPTGEETEPVAGGEGDEKVSAVEPDNLQEVVKMATDSEYWDAEGGGTMEYVDSGYLLVHATPAMQRRVAKLLNGMR